MMNKVYCAVCQKIKPGYEVVQYITKSTEEWRISRRYSFCSMPCLNVFRLNPLPYEENYCREIRNRLLEDTKPPDWTVEVDV